MSDMSCANCRYWAEVKNCLGNPTWRGECRRFPPVYVAEMVRFHVREGMGDDFVEHLEAIGAPHLCGGSLLRMGILCAASGKRLIDAIMINC